MKFSRKSLILSVLLPATLALASLDAGLVRAQEFGVPGVGAGSSAPYQGQNTNVFQMFFSSHVRADTYLVNTASGALWILTTDKDGNNTSFQKMTVNPAPTPTTQAGRYRVYFSAVNRRDTFFMDTVTGKLWLLISDASNTLTFQAIPVEGLHHGAATGASPAPTQPLGDK